jgi:hypothetical protein
MSVRKPVRPGLALEALEDRALLRVSFAPAVTLPAGVGPQSIVTADLNADAKQDVVVLNQGSPMGSTSSVSVLLGNGDGKLDFATANGLGAGVEVFSGSGDGTFASPVNFPDDVFYPPHPTCRFRSYASLQQGSQRWVQRYQGIARRSPAFLTAVNAGDVAGTAHALRQVGYYTATEESDARSMTSAKAQIDHQLGPLPVAPRRKSITSAGRRSRSLGRRLVATGWRLSPDGRLLLLRQVERRRRRGHRRQAQGPTAPGAVTHGSTRTASASINR